MAHQWYHRGLHSALKVAAGVGAIAVAAHGIHSGISLHGEVAAQRQGMQSLHDYRRHR